MAAVDVVISGFLYHGRSGQATPVTIVGIAGLNDLQVGGGPIIPPAQPPGYPPHPAFPIYGPGVPTLPVDPGFGRPGPIQPPTQPPENPSQPKPPPPEGGWGWHPEYGWGYFPGGGGKPQPSA